MKNASNRTRSVPTPVPTQEQMFYQAECRSAALNLLFLEFVEDGLTKEELEACIKRRPAVWGRWAGFLDKLPSKREKKG